MDLPEEVLSASGDEISGRGKVWEQPRRPANARNRRGPGRDEAFGDEFVDGTQQL